MIVPADVEIGHVLPRVVNGETVVEAMGDELIDVLFLFLPDEPIKLVEFLASALAEEAAETLWHEALGGLVPADLTYGELDVNQMKVLHVDFDGISTFDDVEIALEVNCVQGQAIGVLVDLDYSSGTRAGPLLNLLLGPLGAECAQVKEYRAAWSIDCAAIGTGSSSDPATIETETGDATMTFTVTDDDSGIITPGPQAISVRNETAHALDWRASADQTWIGLAVGQGFAKSIAKAAGWRQSIDGTLESGEALDVLVEIDDSLLSLGEHTGTVLVEAGDVEKAVIIVARIVEEDQPDDVVAPQPTASAAGGPRRASGPCGMIGMASFAFLGVGLTAMHVARRRGCCRNDACDHQAKL